MTQVSFVRRASRAAVPIFAVLLLVGCSNPLIKKPLPKERRRVHFESVVVETNSQVRLKLRPCAGHAQVLPGEDMPIWRPEFEKRCA